MTNIINEEVKSDFWTKEVIISKSSIGSDELRVIYNESTKGQFITIRRYYKGDDEEFYPTKKGLSIPVNSTNDLDVIIDSAKFIKDNYLSNE